MTGPLPDQFQGLAGGEAGETTDGRKGLSGSTVEKLEDRVTVVRIMEGDGFDHGAGKGNRRGGGTGRRRKRGSGRCFRVHGMGPSLAKGSEQNRKRSRQAR